MCLPSPRGFSAATKNLYTSREPAAQLLNKPSTESSHQVQAYDSVAIILRWAGKIFVKLTQAGVQWEEGTAIEKTPSCKKAAALL